MIQMGTILDVADNSGAKKIACIQLRGRARHSTAASATSSPPRSRRRRRTARSRRAQVVKAVIVRTVNAAAPAGRQLHPLRHNAAVLINDQKEPIGTRVFGPVARELREKKFMKIISLAPEVI